MENSTLAHKGRIKLGNQLPKHILMQNLLGIGITYNRTKSTQTEQDYCFCGNLTPSLESFGTDHPAPLLPKQANKFTASSSSMMSSISTTTTKMKHPRLPQSKDIVSLLHSLKQRLDIYENKAPSQTTESDWSDAQSICTECEINFPKETRQAIKMHQQQQQHQKQQKVGRGAPPAPPMLSALQNRFLTQDKMMAKK